MKGSYTMTKKIAVINDLSGFGRCSLTAAISVIAAMGVQPCPLPTAVLSAQTGYPSYYCDDYTEKMEYFRSEWKKMGQTFDGIYTGFVASEQQIDQIFGDGHTQTGSSVFFGNGAGCLFERYKKTAQKFFAHPYSGIADGKAQSNLIVFKNELFYLKTYRPSFECEFEGIGQQIQQNLVDPHRIADKGIGRNIGQSRFESEPVFFGLQPDNGNHGFKKRLQFERFTIDGEFAFLDFGHVEHIIDE